MPNDGGNPDLCADGGNAAPEPEQPKIPIAQRGKRLVARLLHKTYLSRNVCRLMHAEPLSSTVPAGSRSQPNKNSTIARMLLLALCGLNVYCGGARSVRLLSGVTAQRLIMI